MSLPRRISELDAEASRLQAQLSGASPQAQEPQTPPQTTQDSEGGQPVAAQVQPATGPEPTTPSTPPSDDQAWERRYRTIQGKYNAEVPRLTADLKDLRNQLATALTEIDRIKALKAEASQSQQPLVTDKDVEAFGSDLIDVIDRKAREVAGNMVSTRMRELETENSRLKEQLTGVSERQVTNDRRTYFMELARMVPDYEALNVDQGFMDWLAEVDPLSGASRQDYLTSAWNAFDASRTAALFNTYKETLARPAPVSQPKQQLQRQVAPGTSKASSAAPTPASAKIWTVGEIEQFYHNVRRGQFHGKDAERVSIEAEIDQAVAEGRVSR